MNPFDSLQRGRSAFLTCCLLWLVGACSSGSGTPTGASGPDDPPRTVLLFVVDGIAPETLVAAGARAHGLAARSRQFDAATTVSLGVHASLASVMTGAMPRFHGVGQWMERGRLRLSNRQLTLAERFSADGYRTLGVATRATLGPRFAGFHQGFETFEVPNTAAGTRTSPGMFDLVRSRAEALFADEEPVFLFVYLDDVQRDGNTADVSDVARIYREELQPFAGQNAPLAAALADLSQNPSAAVAEIERLLARGRGTPAYDALQRAEFLGRVAILDGALGQWLDLLAAQERLDDALIGLVGLRGESIAGDGRTGPRSPFASDSIRVPFWLAGPGIPVGVEADRLVQTLDVVAAIGSRMGWEPVPGEEAIDPLDPEARRDVAFCADGTCELRAAFDGELGVQMRALDEGVPFQREGALRTLPGLSPELAERAVGLRAALERTAELPAWSVDYAGGAGTIELEWRFADGFGAGARLMDGAGEVRGGSRSGGTPGAGQARGIAGSAVLEDLGGRVDVFGSRRALPLRLNLRSLGGEVTEGRVLIGEMRLSELFLPRLPASRNTLWPREGDDPAPARAHLAHHGGAWWRLSVEEPADEGAQVEVLVALFPPGRIDEEIRVDYGPRVTVEAIPGRRDAVWARGKAPFALSVEKTPRRELALVVAIGDQIVPGAEIRNEGLRFATPDEVVLYVPDWMPDVTFELDRPVPADTETPAGTLRLRRLGSGDPRDRAGLLPEDLIYLRKSGGDG